MACPISSTKWDLETEILNALPNGKIVQNIYKEFLRLSAMVWLNISEQIRVEIAIHMYLFHQI